MLLVLRKAMKSNAAPMMIKTATTTAMMMIVRPTGQLSVFLMQWEAVLQKLQSAWCVQFMGSVKEVVSSQASPVTQAERGDAFVFDDPRNVDPCFNVSTTGVSA